MRGRLSLQRTVPQIPAKPLFGTNMPEYNVYLLLAHLLLFVGIGNRILSAFRTPLELVLMTQESVEKVLGRLLTDDIFRNRARESLSRACLEEGYLLSDEESRMVGRLDLLQIDSVAGSLDSGIKRFTVWRKHNGAP